MIYGKVKERIVLEEMFDNCNSVGISAGASTPDEIIQGVVNKIKKPH